jgi:hypothetical protein
MAPGGIKPYENNMLKNPLSWGSLWAKRDPQFRNTTGFRKKPRYERVLPERTGEPAIDGEGWLHTGNMGFFEGYILEDSSKQLYSVL